MYDLAIIGGGAAGLSAALYASRYKLNIIVFSHTFGGTTATAHKICNYPGFTEITGMELASKFIEQAKSNNVPIKYDAVVDIEKNNEGFVISTSSESLKAKKLLLAIGRERRKLGIDREKELAGKGVHYCATCDGGFYKDKIVGVVGGSDAAVTSALLLADLSKKVYLIYRKDKLRAEPSWVELLKKNPKIEVIYNSNVKELIGKEKLEQVKLDKDNKVIDLDGIFIEIGSIPNKPLIDHSGVLVDENGFIKVDNNQKTNIPGIYAAGDSTDSTDLKQIITSASQGAIAAYNIYKELSKN